MKDSEQSDSHGLTYDELARRERAEGLPPTLTEQSDSEVTLVFTVRPGIPVASLVETVLDSAMDWADDMPGDYVFARCEITASTFQGPKVLRSIWGSRS